MSDEQTKEKRTKRQLKEQNAITKQLKIAKQHHLPGTLLSPSEKQPHRLAKHHAMDCGNPDCYLCGNPRKTHKDKLTVQEKSFKQTEGWEND